MNIFSQQDFNDVEAVIKKTNGQSKAPVKPIVKDEIEELNDQSQHIQQLLQEIESLPDENAKELMNDCIQEMLSFYGHGLKRILKIISEGNSEAAKNIYNNLIDDSFINGLLLIHDLHPLDLKTRLNNALEKVKPYMDSHGGSVEIVSLENGIAKLKLSGHCNGCPSSASTLELGIKQAIEEHCPDLLGLEVDGVVAGANNKTEGWKILKGVEQLPAGGMKAMEIDGIQLIISHVNNNFYAYRNLCPACDRSFSNGKLEGNILSCLLGHSYDVVHAGVCTDDEGLHLDPFPLLQENGIIKIAVG